MEEEYELDIQALKEFHARLLNSENISEINIGSEEEFINYINNDQNQLVKFRNNLIEDKLATSNQLGGSDDGFKYRFTIKKKDETQTSSEGLSTPSVLGEEPTTPSEIDRPSIGELKLANWETLSNTDGYGDTYASERYNKELTDKFGDEQFYTKMLESTAKRQNGIRDKIVTYKESNPLNFEEKAIRIGGINIKKSHTKESLERLEEELENEFNPNKNNSISKDIRNSLSYAYEDDVINNLNSFLESKGADMYKAGITNPEYLNDWRKYAGKHVFGEMLDPAIDYIRESIDHAILSNEYMYHTSTRAKEYKDKNGGTWEQAYKRIEMEDIAKQRNHLEANMNKRELAKYEIQKRIDKLEDEDVDGSNFNEIFNLSRQLEGEELLYDNEGKRIVMPENKDMAMDAQLVNQRIDEYNKQKNFKDILREKHHDNWNIYTNLLRTSEEYGKKLAEKQASHGSTGVVGHTSPEDKGRAEHLEALLKQAKINVDATGQMLFANENLAKSKDKFIMGREFLDTMASQNSRLFSDVTQNKTTPFQKTEAFVNTMAEMGNPLSKEQIDEIDWEGAEWARSGAYLADIALKMVAFNKVAGAVGITNAVKGIGSAAKLRTSTLGVGAFEFSVPNLGRLTEHAIMAGWEEATFQIVDGSVGTGALFYGANQAFSGTGQLINKFAPKDPGSVGGILKRNKKFGMFLKAMTRGSFSMTTAMEGVGTVESVIDGWAHDRKISTLMEEQWGAESDWEKRVLMNLALSTIMGAPTYGKMAKSAFKTDLNKASLEIQERLFREGKMELGAEVANVRGVIIDGNKQYETGTNLFKKHEYLIENTDIDPKSLQRKDGSYDPKRINEEFALSVKNDVKLYDEILGKGSSETAKLKKKILKKLGLPVENMTFGAIETAYYKYSHDSAHSKKWGRKITKETLKEEKKIRLEKLKDITKRADAELKEHSVDNSITESSDVIDKIEKSKSPDRSELESQLLISNKKVDTDGTKNQLDKLSKKYGKEAPKKDWEAAEGDMNKLVEVSDRVMGVMMKVGMKDTQIKRMKNLRDSIIKGIDAKKPMTPAKFEKASKQIIDQTKAFSSKALAESINKTIESNSTSSSTNLSHKNRLIADAFDVMFNKIALQNELNNPKTTKTKAEKIEKQLAKYEKFEGLIDRVVGNKLNKRDALEKVEEGGFDEIDRLIEVIDKSISNIDVYEGISNAFSNTKNRGDVRNRKAELREASLERKLEESELVEYEMLNAFDRSTMTQNQLANAHRSINRVISEGVSTYKSEQRHKDFKKQAFRAEIVRDIYNKSFDAENMTVDTDGINEINAILRAYRGSRMWVESYVTMSEYMMSRKSGREALTGSMHSIGESLIQANNSEKASVAQFMNETLRGMNDVFGSTSEAQALMRKWGMGKRNPVKHDFDLGIEIKKMTIPEAMTMYSYMRQPDQIAILEAGGYEIMKNGKMEGASIKNIEAQLTELGGKETIEWVQHVTETLLPKVWNKNNEQYKKDNGVDLEFFERYFPVYRYGKSTQGDFKLAGNEPGKPMPSDHLPSTNKQHLNDRNNASSKYRLKDFNDIMFDYINTSMHYVHYQDVVSHMNSTFTDPTVHDVIHKRFTNVANKALRTLTEDIAHGETQSGSKIEWLDKVRRSFARAKLGFNPTLLPKQMMSSTAFISEMSFAEAGKFTATIPKMSTLKMLMNTPELQNRYRIADFNRDISERTKQTDKMSEKMIEDRIVLSKGKGAEWFKLKNLRDNMLISTKWGDLGAILDGGARFYDVRYDGLIKEGWSKREAHDKALLAVIKGIEKTQQSGAIHNLSLLQRSGSYGKLITLFQNTPLQYLRIEMAAMTSMKQEAMELSRGNGDLGKAASAAKTFMVYHFVLPQLFRAASNGFYLGDDRSFWDDSDLFLSMILGSGAYAPMIGSGAMSLLSNMNKGFSFGTSQNVLSDMLEETDGVLELISDLLMKADDPQGLTIEYEDYANAINGVTQWAGIPSASLLTWGKGIVDYLTDRTDNELALLGYSKSIYQGSLLSRNIEDINMHLPENGGSLDTFIDHMIDKLGIGKFEKQESLLIKEYMMYDTFGITNSHVNYLYRGTDDSHDQAMYLFSLFKAEVLEVKNRRPNYNLRQLRNDLTEGAVYTYPEFMSYVGYLLEKGVISERAYEDFILKMEMPEEEYNEIFDFL